jgi:hypothetical protein
LRIRTAFVEQKDISQIHFKVEPRNKAVDKTTSIREKEVDLVLQ